MSKSRNTLLVVSGMFIGLLACLPAFAQTAIALAGNVTSDAEGPMEGVLVKAKRVGGTITLTVVSDDHGHYAFPAAQLKPGQYEVTVRATGYDIPASAVTVGAETADADLKLNKVSTYVMADQLTPAEWEMSGLALGGCGGCHNLNVIAKSTYDVKGWMATLIRMRNYEPGASFSYPFMLPEQFGPRPADEKFAKYLASINLSSKQQWDFELKSFPRPKGKATKVLITEYDLPRFDAQPHDAVMDSEGIVWYSEFNQPIIGRLDPRTGETKEWTLPVTRPGFAPGSLDIALAPDGNPWIARKFQAGVATLDKKTGKISTYSLPKEDLTVYTRTTYVAVGPDGTVWISDTEDRMMYLLNPTTGKMVGYPTYPGFKWDYASGRRGIGPNGEKEDHLSFGVAVSSKGIGYWADAANRFIGEMDPATGKTKLYPTPTANSGTARLFMTPDDQLWFGERNPSAQKLGVFDTKTKQFKEWDDDPINPYAIAFDKSGHAWTGGTPTDFLTRLDPKTGEKVQYLLPTVNASVQRADADNFTSPPSLVVGETHGAKIALVQPLE
jgi:virginiamycin B lyase